MTQLTPTSRRKSMFGSRVLMLMAVAVVFFVGLSGTARAQWTTPDANNNINNTNSGNVGIGTTNPVTQLHVANQTAASPRGVTNSQHTSDTNAALFTFRKSRGTLTSPAAAVNGDFIGNLYGEAFDGTAYISGGRIRLGVDGTVSSGSVPTSVQFLTGTSGSGVERMRISSAGYVGIGTTNPLAFLHLATNSFADPLGQLDLASDTATHFPNIVFQRSRGTLASPTAVLLGDRLGGFAFRGYGTSQFQTSNDNAVIRAFAAENFTNTAMGTYITFETTPIGTAIRTEKLRILANGSVGIGTTNPVFDSNGGKYLSVDGGSGFIGSIGATGGTNSNGTTVGQVAFVNSNLGGTEKRVATIVGATDTATNSGMLDFYTASAGTWGIPKLRINSGGNVGVGTMSPGFKLDVQGGQLNASGGLCIGGDCKTAWSQVGGGSSQWTTGGSGAVYYNSGNVGIGTATPDVNAKLHLAGSGGIGQDLQTTGNEWSRLRFVVPGRTLGFFLDGGSGGFGTGKFGLHDYTAAAWRLVVDTSGNIGMGTTTPGSPLEVRKDQNAQTLLYINNATAGSGTGAGTGIQFRENATLNSHIFVANSGSSSYLGGARALQFWNYQNSPILFGTNGAERVRFDGSGNVGIGTVSPAVKLDVSGQLHVAGVCGTSVPNSQGGYVSWNQMNCGTGEMDFINHQGGGSGGFWFANTVSGSSLSSLMIIKGDGNVGIGTNTPTAKLDVVGNINVGGTGNLNASGTITAGNIVAKYQDVAEWVETSQALPAGTVVVLDHTRSNQVVASTESYDTRVAGVISAQPGITLGEKGENKVLVATTGRVKVKVDATSGPIKIGDLLVTSNVAGLAMKSEAIVIGGRSMHAPGTLIGKALEPLASGTGEILVLLSLQ